MLALLFDSICDVLRCLLLLSRWMTCIGCRMVNRCPPATIWR
jgi:hypothetical protein